MRPVQQGVAAKDQAAGATQRDIAEGGCLELALDQAGQRIPGQVELPQYLVGLQVCRVTRAGALDRAGRRDQRVCAEGADARVELLVARSE